MGLLSDIGTKLQQKFENLKFKKMGAEFIPIFKRKFIQRI